MKNVEAVKQVIREMLDYEMIKTMQIYGDEYVYHPVFTTNTWQEDGKCYTMFDEESLSAVKEMLRERIDNIRTIGQVYRFISEFYFHFEFFEKLEPYLTKKSFKRTLLRYDFSLPFYTTVETEKILRWYSMVNNFEGRMYKDELVREPDMIKVYGLDANSTVWTRWREYLGMCELPFETTTYSATIRKKDIMFSAEYKTILDPKNLIDIKIEHTED